MSFDSPVNVILGANGGIGSAVARSLATAGAILVCEARNEERPNTLTSAIRAEAFPLDASQPEQVEAAGERVVTLHGRLDAAVSCVGSFLLKPAHLATDAE